VKANRAMTSKLRSAPKAWHIVGYRGLKVFYEQFVPQHRLSEKRALELIRRLLCRHLTEDEVIEHSLDPASPILSPQSTHGIDGGKLVGRWGFSVGIHPSYSAVIVDRPGPLKRKTPSTAGRPK
jgi:hypothetical protein